MIIRRSFGIILCAALFCDNCEPFLAACKQTLSEKYAEALGNSGSIVAGFSSLSGAIIQIIAKEMADEDSRKEQCMNAVFEYLEEKFEEIKNMDKRREVKAERRQKESDIFNGCKNVRSAHRLYKKTNTTGNRNLLIRICESPSSPSVGLERISEEWKKIFENIIENTNESELSFYELGLEYLENIAVCMEQVKTCLNFNATSNANAHVAVTIYNETVVGFELMRARLTPRKDITELFLKTRKQSPPKILAEVSSFFKRLHPFRELFLLMLSKSAEVADDTYFIIRPNNSEIIPPFKQLHGMHLFVHSTDCRQHCPSHQEIFAGKNLQQLFFQDDTKGFNTMTSLEDGLKASALILEEKIKNLSPVLFNANYSLILARKDISMYRTNITICNHHHYEWLAPVHHSRRTVGIYIGWC